MNLYLTEFKAEVDGKLVTFCGPNVPGISFKDAQNYCNNNGIGYCKVIGLLVAEISCNENYTPNFSDMVDYENKRLN